MGIAQQRRRSTPPTQRDHGIPQSSWSFFAFRLRGFALPFFSSSIIFIDASRAALRLARHSAFSWSSAAFFSGSGASFFGSRAAQPSVKSSAFVHVDRQRIVSSL